MIRVLLLTVIPLILPFIGWYIWKVFAGPPKIDPATGDQISPDFQKAPKLKLLLTGIFLMFVTVGGFLLIHEKTADAPYQPIDVEKVIEEEERQRSGGDRTTPR